MLIIPVCIDISLTLVLVPNLHIVSVSLVTSQPGSEIMDTTSLCDVAIRSACIPFIINNVCCVMSYFVSVHFEPVLLDVIASDTLLAVHLHACRAVFHAGVCYELTMYRHAVRILTIYLAVPQICWLFKHLCGRLLDAELLLFFLCLWLLWLII